MICDVRVTSAFPPIATTSQILRQVSNGARSGNDYPMIANAFDGASEGSVLYLFRVRCSANRSGDPIVP